MPLIIKRCRKCGAEFNPCPSRVKRRDYVCYKCSADWYKRPENRAKAAERLKRYRKIPEIAKRHRARRKVRTEIEAERMTKQPCEVCGQEPATAHHDDYSKPLDVRWLCRKHHRLLHLMELGDKQAADGPV